MQSPGDFDVSFTANNRGMRGPADYIYEKPEGVFRIAVLGDSFTFGVGVASEETASAVLEKLLNAQAGSSKTYQVYNFGVNSYSPILEYIYIKKEIVKYKPDLVILMLDISDPYDDYIYEPHIVCGPDGDIIGCDPFKLRGRPDIKALLMRHSRLFYILDQKLFQSFRKMKAIGFINYFTNKFKGIRNKSEILTNKDIDNISFDKFIIAREGKNKDVVMRHWARSAGYIAMIKKYLDERGIRFMLVSYPYGHMVGQDQWAKGRAYWGFERGRVYGASEAYSLIEEFARKNKIGLINLYKPLEAKKDEPLYFDSDGHWTGRGQEVAASAIFDSGIFQEALK
jgi:hypothetical protein